MAVWTVAVKEIVINHTKSALNRGRVTVPLLFHHFCLSNLHIIYGCCSFAAPILFSWHIDK